MAIAFTGQLTVFILHNLLPGFLLFALVCFSYSVLSKHIRGKSSETRLQISKLNYKNFEEDENKSGDEGEATNSQNADDQPNFPLEDNILFIPYSIPRVPVEKMIVKSAKFYQQMNKRRSVRFFSSDPVPAEVMDNLIRTAGTSPSGAHTQPWTYAVVSNAELKMQIREIVEAEEEQNYAKRMSEKWVQDLKKFRTSWIKPYLSDAPYIIVVFKQTHSYDQQGKRQEHYYNEISISISVGFLLAAIQAAGLAALTSTPMNAGPAIRQLLGRPSNEKVVLLLPVGYPANDCTVPDLKRKALEDIMVTYD